MYFLIEVSEELYMVKFIGIVYLYNSSSSRHRGPALFYIVFNVNTMKQIDNRNCVMNLEKKIVSFQASCSCKTLLHRYFFLLLFRILAKV